MLFVFQVHDISGFLFIYLSHEIADMNTLVQIF